MHDEKNSIGTKVRLGQRNILEIRISCAQLKTTRIHDSKVHYKAKVSSHWISKLESKAKVITLGRIWYGDPILAVGNKNSQISQATQWPNYAHFWYSKVGLDWIGTCSKNYIFRGRLPRKTAGQRLTKLSITPGRKFLKSWEIHSRC
jgi:hypothetical protein